METKRSSRRSDGKRDSDGSTRSHASSNTKRNSMYSPSSSPQLFAVIAAVVGLGALATPNLPLPAMVGRESVLSNIAALIGPLAMMFALDALGQGNTDTKSDKSSPSYKLRKTVQRALGTNGCATVADQLKLFAYAAGAAGLANVKLANVTNLLVLNGLGAFINAVSLAISEQHFRWFKERLYTLDDFRGAFCGVLTSFAGMVLISSSSPSYYSMSILVGVAATELGLRLGATLSESVLHEIEERKPGRMALFSHWLPMACAYLGMSAFLTAENGSRAELLASYVFSYIGCWFGGVIQLSEDPLLQDFICNLVAVLSLGISTTGCRRLGRTSALCTSVARSEFENSFAGALSTFCGASVAAHGLLLSLFPEEVIEELYYSPKLIGSTPMKEIDPLLGKDQKETLMRHGSRVGMDLMLVAGLVLSGKAF